MSINPETWRKASRLSDPRVVAAVVLAAAAAATPWGHLRASYLERRAERDALAPILAEAERLNLTFPQVVVSHPAHVGKPVYWAVQVVSTSSTRVDEHPAWQVLWTNPERVRRDSIYGDRVLARVAAVRDDAVYLDYLGRP
jgi:hypothetical protein